MAQQGILQMLWDLFFEQDQDDDSDDEDVVRILSVIRVPEDRSHYRAAIPRVNGYIETVVDAYNEVDFRQAFRVTRTTFEYLVRLLGPRIQGDSLSGRDTIPVDKQIFTLCHLGTPDSFRSETTKFDLGMATAWRSVLRVVSAIYYFRNHFIRWPTREEAEQTARYYQRHYGFPGGILCGDGTHIEIEKPKENSSSWFNRKHYPSINTQVLCDHRLAFAHVFSGYPGSVHDSRVFRLSGLQNKLNLDHFYDENYHILVDSAYTLQHYVMRPYRNDGHLTRKQKFYNKTLSKARASFERAIGLLKIRWRILLNCLPMKRLDLAPYVIVACCVLHNICLTRVEDFVYPVIPPPVEPHPGHQIPTRAERRRGYNKRTNIRNALAQRMPLNVE